MTSYAVLRVKTGDELSVEERLKAKGINAYCPRMIENHRNRRSKSVFDRFVQFVKPLLPGYVLVDENTLELPFEVRAKYLMMGGQLLWLTERQFDAVVKLEQEMSVISNNQIPVSVIKIGDEVSPVEGVLSGSIGRIVVIKGKMAKVLFSNWPFAMFVPLCNLVLYKR